MSGWRCGHARSKPLWQELHVWLRLDRGRVPEGSAVARAIDYSLNAWGALTAHLHDGRVPVDNNRIEELLPHRWQPLG